jgi:acyl-CoA reductase-like NAD-dependent aldehyde dehydrogenase
MTVDGKPCTSSRVIEVTNPATRDLVGRAPVCDSYQLDIAMEGAVRAFSLWRNDVELRRDRLNASAEVIKANVGQLSELLTAEQGKPLREAKAEVISVAGALRYHAKLELTPVVIQDDEKALIEYHRRPIGPVAAITPWNFPLSMASLKIAPALAAGNTVVLKPSPFTPLSSLLLGELLRDTLPPGVLSVISGGTELGEQMVTHPLVRKVSLTGSIDAGKSIASAAAKDLKRLTLELGGNDPAIVLADIDVEAVAKRIFWASFTNCGQVCTAIKRVYAPDDIYDELVEALAEYARRVRVGNGSDESTQIGPLNNDLQLDRVKKLVAGAVSQGAQIAAGGSCSEGRGHFFSPTILADADDGMAVVDEEQFGPVLPVIRYGSLDDAIGRANGTHYGLGASVWGNDNEVTNQIASSLDCGTVWFNTHMASSREQPFAGTKWSGIGVENGRLGMESYTEIQVFHRSRP